MNKFKDKNIVNYQTEIFNDTIDLNCDAQEI